jgi:hypothetical protein
MKIICYWLFIAVTAICQVAEANSYTPIGSQLSSMGWTEARDAESPPRRRMTNSEMLMVNSGIKIRFAGNDFIKRNELFDPKKKDGARRSNVERMREGLAPLGKDGNPINLHHMKQQINGVIVEASHTEHKNNSGSWHRYSRISEIDRDDFNRTRSAYWKERAKDFEFRGQNAGYISLGAAAAMAIGPELSNLFNTGSLTDQTMQRTAHAGSIIAAERVTALTLSKFGNGMLQGGMRGNAIIGLTMLATDTTWSVYEHGGARAFQNEEFYANLGGSIGSLALGMTTGMHVAIAVTTLTASPIIGGAAGLATSFATATAGYIGGRVVTRKILEVVKPELIYKAEDTAIADAQNKINDSISRIQQGLDS